MREHWIGSQIWSWTVKPWKGCVSWTLATRALYSSPASGVMLSDQFFCGSRRHSCLGCTSLQLSDQREKEYLSPAQVWKTLIKRHWLNWLGPCAYPGTDQCAERNGEQRLTQLGPCAFPLKHFTGSSSHMILRSIPPPPKRNVCSGQTKY